MGGADSGNWHQYPEECAVLIGTQDMLLSRAMNRGYSVARARWPMEFGLLNHDCLWVMDEVQLMDVGLATSAQLQAFRYDDLHADKGIRPCHTWWMSATLQPEWLKKSPDTVNMADSLPQSKIVSEKRTGDLWDQDKIKKECQIVEVNKQKPLADLVASEHKAGRNGANGPTLVVVNTVKRAVELYETLKGDNTLSAADVRLVHGRFRPAERTPWRKAFLNRSECKPGTNRIIVATQVIEAGVDISAGVLITEIAPWASLVQRFGRCARWGGSGKVIVFDLKHSNDREAAPYSKAELDAARDALSNFSDVSPLHLESFEDTHPKELDRLYPYNPLHLLLRHELDELFDTTPDLSGSDIDISRFIRSGDERDVHVFWVPGIPAKTNPDSNMSPKREALCAVPFLAARDWLCGEKRASKLKEKMRAWVWDWLDGTWRMLERKDIYPGQTLLVASECGGYDQYKGWTGKPMDNNIPDVTTCDDDSDMSQDKETFSQSSNWKTIATHGREVGLLAATIAERVASNYSLLFNLAGRVHDLGKSHSLFQGMIKKEERLNGFFLAKAPKQAWITKRTEGYRHELASALALFTVLQRHCPEHESLLGPWRELLTAAGMKLDDFVNPEVAPTEIENEICSLSENNFNLLAYLVCAHHGKVRVALHSCPADYKRNDGIVRIRAIHEGLTLPSLPIFSNSGTISCLPETVLTIEPASVGLSNKTGQGWTERVLNLLDHYGPFTLAWLEALFRAADQRASQNDTPDDLLNMEAKP
jgi:CRISPR-associated endonuclease/helicase Cas3